MVNHNQFKKIWESLKQNAPSGCQACGGSLSLEEVNLEDYQGGKLYLMEKVPAMVCQECGEVWVPEKIMHEFENMITTAKKRKAKKKIKRKTVKEKKTWK